jgi:hypothetical protein
MRRPLVIYDFATAPLWISLYEKNFVFFFVSVDCSFLELAYFFEGLPPERESPLHQVLEGLSPGDLLLAQHTLHRIRYSYNLVR